jgi:hypothetical protein
MPVSRFSPFAWRSRAVLLSLAGSCARYKDTGGFIHCEAFNRAITFLQCRFPIRAPIADANERGTRITGIGMTEQEDRLAREREEIAMRVANFRATQEKFERAREEYFVTTLENALNGYERRRFWA